MFIRSHAAATLVAVALSVGAGHLPGNLSIWATPAAAQTLTPAFTYQGELQQNSAPANGTFDLSITAFDAPTDGLLVGSQCFDDVQVVNGRFAVTLNIANFANGTRRFLEIAVRPAASGDCSSTAGYSTLLPRQEVTATPYAAYALTAADAANAATLGGQNAAFFRNAANLQGTLPTATLPPTVARTDASQTFTGQVSFTNSGNLFVGNGAGLTSLNGANLQPGTLTRNNLTPDVQLSIGTPGTTWTLPQRAGSIAFGSPGFVRPALRGNLYIYTRDSRLQFVDVSNPSSPVSIGVSPIAPESLRDVAVSGDLAVARTATGFRVFNIQNPAAATQIAAVTTPAAPQRIALSGNLLVVGAGSTLYVYNLATPAAPVLAGSVASGATSVRDIVARGTLAYFTYANGFTAVGVRIMDFSNPAAPTLRGTVTGFGYAQGIDLSGNHALIADYNARSLVSVNIANPDAPAIAATLPVPETPMWVATSGNLLFVNCNIPSRLRIYDITSPASPALLSNFDTAPLFLSDTPLVANDTMALAGGLGSTMYIFVPGRTLAFTSPVATTFSGSLSAASLSGSGAGLTALPAGNLTGAVPPAALTSVPAASLTGAVPPATLTSVPAASLTGTLPTATLPGTVARTDVTTTFAGNIGIGASPGTFPLAFANSTGPKVSLFSSNGNAFYGLGVQNSTLQILTENIANSTVFGSGSSASLTEAARIYATGRMRIGTTTNPPNAGLEVGGGIMTNSFATAHNQGAYMEWNKTNGDGATWLLNQKGGGPGGFRLGEVDNGNTVSTRATLDANGNLTLAGAVFKAGGTFMIDHPLDPQNKILSHSFVESPDMMNIYNGNITTDAAGYATVTLPAYFEALNKDFRYQLTVIDEADSDDILWAKVVRKINDNQFTLRTSRPNVEVSWQVTGVRKDAWAEKNRIVPEVLKPAEQRGKYLHPEAFGKPPEMGVYTITPNAPSAPAASPAPSR